jgi:heme/copper-type cytochrome/quinol oxidase subunit 4
MPLIAAIREAEPWTTFNLLGAALLFVAAVAGAYWLLKRYLSD